MLLKFLSIFIIFVAVSSAQKPVVSVYYEVLCPDSQNFYKNQFYPTYNKLGRYFTPDLLPYGKATHEYKNKKWVFQCQHGPAECYSNTVQACVLNNANATEEQKLKFVNCVLVDSNPKKAEEKCAELSGLNWNSIEYCLKTDQGASYLAAYGDRTHALKPNLSFVPTIVFNGVYNQQLQNKALRNFQEALCSQLPEPVPAACTRR